MPVQRVAIGNHIIESPELDWDTIIKVASQLRKIADWDPDKKIWNVNWKLFSSYKEVAMNLNNIKNESINNDFKKYLDNLLSSLKSVLDKAPKIIEKGPYVLIQINDCNPFQLVKVIKESLFDVKLTFERIQINNDSNIAAPYLSLPKNFMSKFISISHKLGKSKCFPKIESYPLIKKIGEQIYIYSKDIKNLIIVIPNNLDNSIIKEIKKFCRIEYYVNDLREGLIKREVDYYKEFRKQDSIIVKLPKFLFAKIIDLFEKNGLNYKVGDGVLDPPKEIDVPKTPSLFDYQEKAYRKWENNNFWGTIVIPTGGGKTFLGLAAISKIKKPTLILVPNLWLLHQWIDRISSILGIPRGMIGIVGGGEKRIKDITVSTYQSAHKNIEQFSNKFHLVIFDEAHHVPASTFKKAALYLAAPYRMALSATPKRADKNEILLFKLAGDIVFEISYSELVKKGYVAPLVVRKIFVKLPKDMEREYNRIQSNLRFAYDELAKKQIINKLIEISRDNPEKIPVIKKIVKKHSDEKIFIFAGSIDFAKQILNALKNSSRVSLLTSETKKSEEKRIIRSFMNGIINVLILVKKGEEGVDVGDASVAIIAGGTKQRRETIQRIGRILRGGKDKLAWVYEIVTASTIEEKLSKGRRIESLVKGLEGIIKSKYGVTPYKVIYWEK